MSAALKLLVFSVFMIFLVQSIPTGDPSIQSEDNSVTVEKDKRCMQGIDLWVIPLMIIAYPFGLIWSWISSLFG